MRSRYLPWQDPQVASSGVIEVLGASMLLIPRLTSIASAWLLPSAAHFIASSLPLVFQNASICVKESFSSVACSFEPGRSLLSIDLRTAPCAPASLVMIFFGVSSSLLMGGIGFLPMVMAALLITANQLKTAL